MSRNNRRGVGRILYRERNLIKRVCPVEIPSSMRRHVGLTAARNSSEPSPVQLLPLKHLRLQELADAGFNCPDFAFWLRGELDIRELREKFDQYGKISLRTFKEEDVLQETPKLEVLYGQDDWKVVKSFCERWNPEYHTLVNRSLPLGDSLLTGNIILLDNDRYALSCFEGSGTPRDVDENISILKIHRGKFSEASPDLVPVAPLYELIMRLREFHPDFRPMTVEFSIYPYSVGTLHHPEILWEWRGGSTHDFDTVVAALLKNGGAYDLTLSLSAATATKR